MATIGWIGLGNMGGPMSTNLVKAGHVVRGFDLNPDAATRAAAAGVTVVESIAAACEGADAIFTMLPKGEHVLGVFGAPGGIWESASRDAILIDSSTIDIATSQKIHDASIEQGFSFVDAPVSGGTSGAAAGTLAFMLGGAPGDIEKAASFIEPMAGKIFEAGGPTMGLAAKIANNMMLFITMLANSEGSQLAEQLGLDPQVFWEIASASSGRSWSQQTWYPVPGIIDSAAANNNFNASFAVDLARKDVGLALDAGRDAGINLPAATLIAEQFDRLIEEGYADRDCTLVTKFVNPDESLRGWNPEL